MKVLEDKLYGGGMTSVNIPEWIFKNRKFVGQDILEVGSRHYADGAVSDLRELIVRSRGTSKEEPRIVGCDLAPGENVDVVADLTDSMELIAEAFNYRMFDTIFCLSVLEHVPDCVSMARNLSTLLKPGGVIFVSVPFVFRLHEYPVDMWRFTPDAVKFIFPTIDFRELKYSNISTLEDGDVMPLSAGRMDKLNRFIFRPKERDFKLNRKQDKSMGKDVKEYMLAPTMINMLGFKAKS